MSATAVESPIVTNGHANGVTQDDDIQMNGTSGEAHARFATGLILPPPDIKSIIDRTAGFVARSANPIQFEDKVREGQRSDPKFSFLNPADPYHAYYRHKMIRISQGEDDEAVVAQETVEEEVVEEQPKGGVTPLEPPPSEFILDLPPISAVDLDIIKLTALFTARRGRSFLQSLAAREARNFEFDFLRPTHSLFGYFNALVEQYSKVLYPSEQMLEKLKKGSEDGARWKMLEISKQHAEFERLKRDRERKKQDDREAEKIAFAEIDWHDYAIVQTIEFTQADANSELPPPMSVHEMVSRTLAQKKMAAMIMEDTVEEVEAVRARQAAAEAEAAAGVGSAGAGGADVQMVEEEEDDAIERRKREEEERQRELERARAIQATSMDASGPMKIRTDYVPKLGTKGGKVTMTTCTICGQQVPVEELQEHMRIELLDPRWKSQRDALEARRAQQSELQRGANVESSLRSLAKARVDIFGTEADEEKRKKEEQEEVERRRQREKDVWDGHTASKDKTLDKFQSNVNFDEQIAALHRAKGLGPVDTTAGPGIGPSIGPGVSTSLPPPPPSLPAPPHQLATAGGSGVPDPAFAAATVSAGPQPASMYSSQPAPVMLPPLHYQGLDAAQPFGYQPPPSMAAGMHPARLAALSASPPIPGGPQAGMVRSADQMEGIENGEGIPPAKKQKVVRLPGGQYYPEQDWVNLHPHPISVQIQLPDEGSRPEWKMNGSVVTLPEIPVTFLVSTLRDHVARHIGSSVPLSRIMLSFNGKMLTNANTLASYNVEDEDLLVLAVRDPKKKK